MRLTLRTLLAYLDDILDPADADELGSKVRESDFASGLVHRIRSVTGRLRLSAPPVEGRGLGADANSVAEYLDNTLPADRIPEFEKVCLESDMHLAEVASSHQVLTLVLGEPAHVDLNLRNRIHNLPVLPPSPAAGTATLAEDQAAVAAAAGHRRMDAPAPASAPAVHHDRLVTAIGKECLRERWWIRRQPNNWPRPSLPTTWRPNAVPASLVGSPR